jgi:hypothetical protein
VAAGKAGPAQPHRHDGDFSPGACRGMGATGQVALAPPPARRAASAGEGSGSAPLPASEARIWWVRLSRPLMSSRSMAEATFICRQAQQAQQAGGKRGKRGGRARWAGGHRLPRGGKLLYCTTVAAAGQAAAGQPAPGIKTRITGCIAWSGAAAYLQELGGGLAGGALGACGCQPLHHGVEHLWQHAQQAQQAGVRPGVSPHRVNSLQACVRNLPICTSPLSILLKHS